MANRSIGKSLLYRVAAMLCAATFTLLMVEVCLRLMDYPPQNWSPFVASSATGYTYAPNLNQRMRASEFDVVFRTNSLGMRDDEVGPKLGYRVLVLGDSFASGYGVERSQMFADHLERALGIDVLNAAVGGWEIIHQLVYFREDGRQLHPDMVLYALYLGNDLTNNGRVRLNDVGILTEPSVPIRAKNRLRLRLLLGRIKNSWRFEQALRNEREWEPYPNYLALCANELSEEARMQYREAQSLLRALRAEVENDGAKFVVTMFSYRTSIDDAAADRLRRKIPDFEVTYDLERPAREMAAFFSREGIDYIDLNPALRDGARRLDKPLYYFSDGHFTAEGHAVVAQALDPEVRCRIETAVME